ncbi:MAG TPA: DUF167 domain-containing protein [Thermoleophilia bacterium]|nr:DUF167 domain-containing protein [Thermoleophilia bacterium]
MAVWATPGASRSEITGVAEGWVRVRLRAPAREGKANAELARLLAAKLGVRAEDVHLRAGAHGRRKTVHVRGVDVAAARARLES